MNKKYADLIIEKKINYETQKSMDNCVPLTILAFVSSIVIFNISHNAVFTELNSYICEKHSIVKAVEFDNNQFYSFNHSEFIIYVNSNCTFEQAKEIFEDFIDHFSDELIDRLRSEVHGKAFLSVDFTNADTNQRMYGFETDDTENFVHWKGLAVGGIEEMNNYTFDRELD